MKYDSKHLPNLDTELRAYHWHDRHCPELKGIKIGGDDESTKKAWCGFGLELEVEYSRRWLEHFSNWEVHGCEIVTLAHTPYELYKLLDDGMPKALSYLQTQDMRSEQGGNCGLHVHISREFFGRVRRDDRGQVNERQDNEAKFFCFLMSYAQDWMKASWGIAHNGMMPSVPLRPGYSDTQCLVAGMLAPLGVEDYGRSRDVARILREYGNGSRFALMSGSGDVRLRGKWIHASDGCWYSNWSFAPNHGRLG